VERDDIDVFPILVITCIRLSVVFAEIRVQNLLNVKQEF
jgi:hypothetical protein